MTDAHLGHVMLGVIGLAGVWLVALWRGEVKSEALERSVLDRLRHRMHMRNQTRLVKRARRWLINRTLR